MTKLKTLLASLVTETTSGVVSARADAAEKERELLDGLAASPESLVSDRMVRKFLQDRFPPLQRQRKRSQAGRDADDAGDGETAIRPGAVYVHPDDFEHATEFPPIEDELGVQLDDEALDTQNGQTVLSAKAVDQIEGAVRTHLGKRRQDVLGGVAEYGMPMPEVTDVDVSLPCSFDDDLEVTVVGTDDDVDPKLVGHLSAHVEFRRR